MTVRCGLGSVTRTGWDSDRNMLPELHFSPQMLNSSPWSKFAPGRNAKEIIRVSFLTVNPAEDQTCLNTSKEKKIQRYILKEPGAQRNDLPLDIFPPENSPLPDLSHASAQMSLASLLSPKINCLRCEWVKTTQRCHYFAAIDHTLGNTSQ